MTGKALIDWHGLPPAQIEQIQKEAESLAEHYKGAKDSSGNPLTADSIAQRIARVEARQKSGPSGNPLVTNESPEYWAQRRRDYERYILEGDNSDLKLDNLITDVDYTEIK